MSGKKLQLVLLVDDSEADNFFNGRIIKKSGITEELVIKTGVEAAFDYMTTVLDSGALPEPQLIFLDINMPKLTGWDFLDRYEKLTPEQRGGIVICMLSTSSARQDYNRALAYDSVATYIHKPLSEERLHEIMRENFPDYGWTTEGV